MSNAIITVENLTKRYVIGHQRSKDDGFRHVIEDALRNPVGWIRRRKQARTQEKEEFLALKNLSFEVQRGDILGVIGRNGAGKSTLLKVLSRITEPTSGRITLDGRVASLLEVGTGFHPELTGRENIFLNGAILGMSRNEIKRKFDEIVAFSEVERFLDTPVKRYSSGMYVRLAFAVAAHLEPEILIVDEVLAVGDLEFQRKCMGKMEDVSKGGRTIVFVSHNMDAVQRLCTKAIYLREGSLFFQGSTKEAVTLFTSQRSKQPSLIDLRTAARGLTPRLKAKYTTVAMIKQGIEEEWAIRYGEQPAFAIGLESRDQLSGIELGISIFSATGTEIASNLSTHKLVLNEVEPGSHTFEAKYTDLRLLPGSYYVQIGMRSSAGFEDFIPRACTFEVLPSVLSSRQMTDTMRGLIVPEVNYTFN